MSAATPRLPVRLYNAAARLGEWVGRRTPRFAACEDRFLQSASRATGIENFGDETFLVHLRVLLRAYDEEARLTPFGRMLVTREISGILKSRLRVERAWAEDPGLLETAIRRPIFILGLPRTGTTALHHLLACDPYNQVLEYWLAAAPGPRPPRSQWEDDPCFKTAVRGLRTMYTLDPGLKAVHWMTADGPDECRHLFLQSFLDDTFDSNASIPSYTRWVAEQDMRPAYARHRDLLKLIGSTSPDRRWVLKYPAHLRNLRTLLEIYPDACIVQTHRDPARVLPSICSLVAGFRGLYEDAVDAAAIGRWQLEMWSDMMNRALDVRDSLDPARFFDLPFAEVVADPVGAVKRMYDHFGFALSPGGEERMRDWHTNHPQGEHGEHRYAAQAFGLSQGEIAERFRRYTERFGISQESGG